MQVISDEDFFVKKFGVKEFLEVVGFLFNGDCFYLDGRVFDELLFKIVGFLRIFLEKLEKNQDFESNEFNVVFVFYLIKINMKKVCGLDLLLCIIVVLKFSKGEEKLKWIFIEVSYYLYFGILEVDVVMFLDVFQIQNLFFVLKMDFWFLFINYGFLNMMYGLDFMIDLL